MGGLVSLIKQRPETRITTTDRCDDICAACPHNGGGRCSKRPQSEETVRRGDRAVLALLGLKAGIRSTARQVYGSVVAEVSATDMGRTLCAECEWRDHGFCEEGLHALKRGEFFSSSAP